MPLIHRSLPYFGGLNEGMTAGTGIDMIEVERVAEKIMKNNGFRELVFSETEIVYCERMTHKYQHYAARFAAKEAFLKAIGTGWTSGLQLNKIEVVHDSLGKPAIRLDPEMLKALPFHFDRVHLSMSHLQNIATAIVIIEKDKEEPGA